MKYREAAARDKKVVQKLTPDELTLYKNAVDTLINGGFARKMTENDETNGHFIAVRPVFKKDRSSTKCRSCVDARTLNKYTHQGDLKTAKILQVLMRFRTSKTVAVFDLEKAFWQVQLSEPDQKYSSRVICGVKLIFTNMILGGNFSPCGLEQALKTIYESALKHMETDSPLEPDEPPRPKKLDYINYVDDYLMESGTEPDLVTQVKWLRWFLNQYGFPSGEESINDK